MGSELALIMLLRGQLALSATILLVLALRRPARRHLGPELAYALWVLVPLAAASSLFPPLGDFLSSGPDRASPASLGLSSALTANAVWDRHAPLILRIWAAGALCLLFGFILAEARFRRAAQRGRAGPAVVGLAPPRLVVPRDYEKRFDAGERRLIREHERAHVLRSHPLHNAVSTALQVVGWFNPLLHWAAAASRLDQELACDAAVLENRAVSKRAYAEVLLKASGPLTSPLSCALSKEGRMLELRVRHIMRPSVSLRRYLAGLIVVGVLGAGLVTGLWASEPAEGLGASGLYRPAPARIHTPAPPGAVPAAGAAPR